MNKIIRMFFVMTVLTGVIYPAVVTLVAQFAMPHKANGSFIAQNEKQVGSLLIGQKFDKAGYFWGRPSATDYSALPSGGSNLGPTSKALKKLVDERKQKYSYSKEAIPSELLYASGSGLDPEISLDAAYYQIERIANERKVDNAEIRHLVDSQTIPRSLGILGEERVNVLALNLALDELHKKAQATKP